MRGRGGPPFRHLDQPERALHLPDAGRRNPMLVRGESPWSGTTRWLPCAGRTVLLQAGGERVQRVDRVPGRRPRQRGTQRRRRDLRRSRRVRRRRDDRWNEAYWQRLRRIIRTACAHGNTVFLYPLDGWNVGPKRCSGTLEPAQARRFGQWSPSGIAVPRTSSGCRWRLLPGGRGPARGSDVDQCIDALSGRSGDARPFSIQLGYDKSLSTESPYWAGARRLELRLHLPPDLPGRARRIPRRPRPAGPARARPTTRARTTSRTARRPRTRPCAGRRCGR